LKSIDNQKCFFSLINFGVKKMDLRVAERAFSERRRSGSKCERLAKFIFRQKKYSLVFFGFVFAARQKGRQP
jgi:hypothetical protein